MYQYASFLYQNQNKFWLNPILKIRWSVFYQSLFMASFPSLMLMDGDPGIYADSEDAGRPE